MRHLQIRLRARTSAPLLFTFLVMVLGACTGLAIVGDDRGPIRAPVPSSTGPSSADRNDEKPVDGGAGATSPRSALAEAERERRIRRILSGEAQQPGEEIDRGAIERGDAGSPPTPEETEGAVGSQ